MTAIIFPGQGSQYINMSMDFNENFDVARKVFQEIEDSTQINIRKIISENPLDNLNQTKYTQISIFSASIAIYKSLLNELGEEIIKPKILLGHSLGEYSALAAANLISIPDVSVLIKKRGELMHSSIEPNVSGMAAIIGKNASFIDDVIKKNNLKVVIANDNSPLQVVVSGLIEDIVGSEQVFSENGVKRYVKLNVSAAFHSNFMNDAQRELINEIDKINFKNSNLPIISNYDSKINSNIDSIKYALKNQMANRVRWTDSIRKLEETDITQIIEIGPGKVLSGLIARISKKFDIKSIDKIEDLKKFN
ncbi:ACP S-malonyltransferase [Alphaproteobacteria bacterium]|nr:ACP S-malonyltransferase [Alphaproteobacteria bacterium]